MRQEGKVNHHLVVNSVGQLGSWTVGQSGTLEPWNIGTMEQPKGRSADQAKYEGLGPRNLFLQVLQYRFAPRPYMQLLVNVADVGPDGFGADR